MKILLFFQEPSVQAGLAGAASYWLFDSINLALGVLLSMTVTLSSIAYHFYKIKAIRAKERREEERHQQELRQDQERHLRDLNNNNSL